MSSHELGIVAKLREFLESNRFPPQSRIPPERVLVDKLGVSRTSLRKGLSALEEEGRIWRHVGRGTFVGPRPEPDEKGLTTVKAVTNPTEIMEARLALEPKLAGIAALRSTMDELSQMENYLERSKEAVDTRAFEHWDGLLHETIAKATDNSLLISLFMVIHNIRESDIWGGLKEASLTTERKKLYWRQHKDLVKTLKDRDAVQAERIMRNHLETVSKHLLELSP